MEEIGVELSFQTSRSFERQPGTLVVTTSHSFKGYESEVVVIPCVDQFVTADGRVLASNLYVAMTRARSLLAVYGCSGGSLPSQRLIQAISDCIGRQNAAETVDAAASIQDDLTDLLKRIGAEHRSWLVNLWKAHTIHQEPIINDDGRIIVEPLFWLEHNGVKWACFWNAAGDELFADACADSRIRILHPGDIVS
jgi:hypothetical protein